MYDDKYFFSWECHFLIVTFTFSWQTERQNVKFSRKPLEFTKGKIELGKDSCYINEWMSSRDKKIERPNRVHSIIYIQFFFLLISLTAVGCLKQNEPDATSTSYSLDALSDTYAAQSINSGVSREASIRINNLNNHHIYVTFTNTSHSTISVSESVSSLNLSISPLLLAKKLLPPERTKMNPVGLSPQPSLNNFSLPSAETTKITGPSFDYIAGATVTTGTTTKAWNGLRSGTTAESISTTLRGWAKTHKGHRVYFWVEDSTWSDIDALGKVSPAKRDVLLRLFNGCTENNGGSCNTSEYESSMLYQLERTIAPYWGAHSDVGYLDSSYDEIHVLMYSIDSTGGVLGFFYPVDTTPGVQAGGYTSNEALVIHLDSNDFSNDSDSDGIWRPYENYPSAGSADIHPKEILSTALHEMQHMIHYYNRKVLHGISSDTWINEMASMLTEDAFSYLYFGSENGPGHTGRMQEYINNPSCNFSTWANTTVKYACAYSFGAFLARQLNSKDLLKNIVLSEKNGMALVDDLFSSSASYKSILVRHGASIVMNPGKASIPEIYLYGPVDGFPLPYEKIKYEPINLYSFTQTPVTSETPPSTTQAYSSSTYLFLKNQSGSKDISITVPENITVTFILEPQ